MIETLTVDIEPKSDGWNQATSGDLEEGEEQAVAAERDSELAEENEELRKSQLLQKLALN